MIGSAISLNTSQSLVPSATAVGSNAAPAKPTTETADPSNPTPPVKADQPERSNDPLRPQTAQSTESQNQPSNSNQQGAQRSLSNELDDPRLQARVRELARIDQEVRAHEAAHAAAGGGLAGAPSFSYTRGPDGQLYATGGEVGIDSSKGATPEQTAQKARTVIAAALAPANPSPQDLRVAAQARAQLITAQAEIARQQDERPQGDPAAVQREVAAGAQAPVQLSAQQVEPQTKDRAQQTSEDRFQQSLERQQERAERIRQKQLEFQQELAELNARIQAIQQQLIDTGQVDPASLLQGSLLDTQA